jgi:hypothetical protein
MISNIMSRAAGLAAFAGCAAICLTAFLSVNPANSSHISGTTRITVTADSSPGTNGWG